jgi:thioredoxin 1
MNLGGETMIHIESSSQFDEVINKGITLVDFYASWCGPCRMIAPFIEEIESEYEGKIKVAKLDVDECGEIASRFGINAIPALLIFKDNELKSSNVGFMPKDNISELVNKVLAE